MGVARADRDNPQRRRSGCEASLKGLRPYRRGSKIERRFTIKQRGLEMRPSNPAKPLDVNASAVLRDELRTEIGVHCDRGGVARMGTAQPPRQEYADVRRRRSRRATFRVKMHSFDHMEIDKATSATPISDAPDKLEAGPQLNAPTLDASLPPPDAIIVGGPNAVPVEIGQSTVALLKPLRKRDKTHRDFVSTMSCLRPASFRCASGSHARSDARSAMNSPCPCAVSTIASFIAAARKRDGGRPRASTRWKLRKGYGERPVTNLANRVRFSTMQFLDGL